MQQLHSSHRKEDGKQTHFSFPLSVKGGEVTITQGCGLAVNEVSENLGEQSSTCSKDKSKKKI